MSRLEVQPAAITNDKMTRRCDGDCWSLSDVMVISVAERPGEIVSGVPELNLCKRCGASVAIMLAAALEAK